MITLLDSVECIHRYYESRRRLFLDGLPSRMEIKSYNDRKSKKSQRQRAVRLIIIIIVLCLLGMMGKLLSLA